MRDIQVDPLRGTPASKTGARESGPGNDRRVERIGT
jgi:hypothetical protein